MNNTTTNKITKKWMRLKIAIYNPATHECAIVKFGKSSTGVVITTAFFNCACFNHTDFSPNMKYFFLVGIASMALLTFVCAAPQCHMEEVFTCLDNAIDFLHSLPKRSLLQNNEDIDRFCSSMNKTMVCLMDYRSRCMTLIQIELSRLVGEGIMDLNSKFCSAGSAERENYLKHAECLNKVSSGDGTRDNLQYLLAIAERVMKVPNNQRLLFMCCGYAKMYNSIRTEATSTCGEEATQVGEELVSMAIAQLPNIACTGYDGDSAECSAVLPPTGAKPSEEFKENPIYKFIFNILKNYLE